MNAFEKRISLEDIKPGVVVWPVFSVTGSVAAVCNPAKFISGVFKCPVVGKMRFQWDPENSYHTSYLEDSNVKGAGTRQYNFHALFLNEKDAEEYAAMINNNQLPDDLRELRDEFVKQKQEEREMDSGSWW